MSGSYRFIALAGFTVITAASVLGQDAAAVAALTKASQALNGNSAITAAVLTGNINYVAGSTKDYGAIVLAADANLGGKILLHLSSGDFSETQQTKKSVWTDANGVDHPIALHNRQASVFWFAPALLVNQWLSDTKLTVTNGGTEDRDGATVQRLHCERSYLDQTDAGTSAQLGKAGAMDLFLDNATSLPAALEFNIHPDGNELVDLSVRIEFSDYRDQSGGKVPFHLLKYFQGSLLYDIIVNSIDLNPVASAADLTAQR